MDPGSSPADASLGTHPQPQPQPRAAAAPSSPSDAHRGWEISGVSTSKCDLCHQQRCGAIQKCCECKLSVCKPCSLAGRLDSDPRHALDPDAVSWDVPTSVARRRRAKVSHDGVGKAAPAPATLPAHRRATSDVVVMGTSEHNAAAATSTREAEPRSSGSAQQDARWPPRDAQSRIAFLLSGHTGPVEPRVFVGPISPYHRYRPPPITRGPAPPGQHEAAQGHIRSSSCSALPPPWNMPPPSILAPAHPGQHQAAQAHTRSSSFSAPPPLRHPPTTASRTSGSQARPPVPTRQPDPHPHPVGGYGSPRAIIQTRERGSSFENRAPEVFASENRPHEQEDDHDHGVDDDDDDDDDDEHEHEHDYEPARQFWPLHGDVESLSFRLAILARSLLTMYPDHPLDILLRDEAKHFWLNAAPGFLQAQEPAQEGDDDDDDDDDNNNNDREHQHVRRQQSLRVVSAATRTAARTIGLPRENAATRWLREAFLELERGRAARAPTAGRQDLTIRPLEADSN